MPRKSKTKQINTWLQVFLFVGFFSTFFIGQVLPARADVWGATWAANLMLNTLTKIDRAVEGVTLSIVKNAALKTVNEQVLRLVNGTGGTGSLVISDWKKFIYTESSKKAEDVVLNDFFPTMFSGKSSGSNYTSSSEGTTTVQNLSSSINTIKNYPEYLSTIGKKTLSNLKSTSTTKYSLDQVCSNPSSSLAKGDYRCFSEIMKPQNNPRGISILTEEKYNEEKTKNQTIAQTQAGITGYKPQTNSKGLVVTPPQTIADIVSTIQTLPAKAIALAQNPSELITGIIQTYVNSMIQKTLSKVGLGSVGTSFAQNLSNEISSETDTLIKDNVGALFGNNTTTTGGVGTDIVGPNDVGSEKGTGIPDIDDVD